MKCKKEGCKKQALPTCPNGCSNGYCEKHCKL